MPVAAFPGVYRVISESLRDLFLLTLVTREPQKHNWGRASRYAGDQGKTSDGSESVSYKPSGPRGHLEQLLRLSTVARNATS